MLIMEEWQYLHADRRSGQPEAQRIHVNVKCGYCVTQIEGSECDKQRISVGQ